MPEISVIIPVYNVEKYLRECLDSILAQTFTDWEAICVNDGATDNSPAILAEYAAKDPRIKIVDQPNSGAGAARNNGMQHASGKYWMFLDSDDRFMPGMLHELLQTATGTNAQVTACAHQVFDDKSGKVLYHSFYKNEMLAKPMPFDLKNPESAYPLLWFTIAPWVYLFSAEYIRNKELQFQHLPRANDFYFDMSALMLADRVSLVNKILVDYRTGMTTNLQSGNSKSPLAVIQALRAIAEKLKSAGCYEIYYKRFSHVVLKNCLYNLLSMKTGAGFKELFDEIKLRFFPDFGLDRAIAADEPFADFQEKIINSSDPVEFMLAILKDEKQTILQLHEKNSLLQEHLDELKKSGAYRTGAALLKPLHKMKELFYGSKKR